jgi:hypothetical protein
VVFRQAAQHERRHAGDVAQAAAPPPLAPTARVAEILERFYLEDARLTAELLSTLAECTQEELADLFLSRSRRPQVAKSPEHEPVTSAAPRCSPTGEVAEKPRDPHANWKWDERGNRISPKLPSAFAYTRQLTQPRRDTFWSD